MRVDGRNDLGGAGPADRTGTEAATVSTSDVPATVVAVFTGLAAGPHEVRYRVTGNVCWVNRADTPNAALVEETG